MWTMEPTSGVASDHFRKRQSRKKGVSIAGWRRICLKQTRDSRDAARMRTEVKRRVLSGVCHEPDSTAAASWEHRSALKCKEDQVCCLSLFCLTSIAHIYFTLCSAKYISSSPKKKYISLRELYKKGHGLLLLVHSKL